MSYFCRTVWSNNSLQTFHCFIPWSSLLSECFSWSIIIFTMEYSQNPTTLSRVNITIPPLWWGRDTSHLVSCHPIEVSIRIHKLIYQGNVSRPRPSGGSWPAPPKGRTHLLLRGVRPNLLGGTQVLPNVRFGRTFGSAERSVRPNVRFGSVRLLPNGFGVRSIISLKLSDSVT